MKHLQDYIVESSKINEGTTSKTISFNFKDLENGKETIESLKDKEGVEVDEEGEKITVTINTDNVDKLGTVQDILQQFTDKIRNSEKRTNDEQYAQKTAKFEETLKDFNDAIDEIKNPEEE